MILLYLDTTLFQFLNGTIGVRTFHQQLKHFTQFQFLNGTIGVPRIAFACRCRKVISIPKWYDWSHGAAP